MSRKYWFLLLCGLACIGAILSYVALRHLPLWPDIFAEPPPELQPFNRDGKEIPEASLKNLHARLDPHVVILYTQYSTDGSIDLWSPPQATMMGYRFSQNCVLTVAHWRITTPDTENVAFLGVQQMDSRLSLFTLSALIDDPELDLTVLKGPAVTPFSNLPLISDAEMPQGESRHWLLRAYREKGEPQFEVIEYLGLAAALEHFVHRWEDPLSLFVENSQYGSEELLFLSLGTTLGPQKGDSGGPIFLVDSAKGPMALAGITQAQLSIKNSQGNDAFAGAAIPGSVIAGFLKRVPEGACE